MQKKIWCISLWASLGLSSSLFANTDSPFNGFYAGGSLGSSFTNGQQHISGAAIAEVASGLLISTTLPINLQSEMVKNAWIGSFFAGFGRAWKQLYLGGELGLTASDYRLSNSLDTGLKEALLPTTPFEFLVNADANIMTKANISPLQFNAALRPGLLLTKNTLLFTRFGLTVADLNYSASTKALTSSSFFGLPALVIPTTLSPSIHHQRVIFQTGGGLEQMLSDHWSVRVDYIYTYYGTLNANQTQTTHFTFNIEDQAIPGSFTVVGNNKVKISSQAVMLGFVGHFDFPS